MFDFLPWLIDLIQSVHWLTRDALAGLAIMLETSLFVGLIIPGDTVVLVASVGVQNFLDFLGLLGFVLLGSLVGETGGFFIGRFFGERVRNSWLGKKLGESNWKLADAFVATRGGLAVAISRFLPVLHSLVPVTAGMTRMRYRVFISWTAAACLVWASAYVTLGWLAHSSYDQLASKLKYGSFIFVGVLIAVVVLFSLGKKRLEAKAQALIESSQAAEAAVAGGVKLGSETGSSNIDLRNPDAWPVAGPDEQEGVR